MSENSYLITLLQKENQTIIAYELNDKGEYTGVSHTESFFAKANSKWKFTVIPDKFHDDYWIHIIQSDHQTITVRDNARFHDYRAGVLVSYPDDDKLTGIQAGDLNSGIYPETNYDVAVENPHDRYKYLVINQNCRIFATLARDLYNNTDYHTISIKQIKHQTIVLTYRNKKYYTDTIVEDNEDYTVELIPDSGYTATSLIINGKTINSLKYIGKATEDLTITAAVQSQAGTDSNYLEFIFKEFDSKIERFNNSDGKLLVGTLQVVAEPEIKTYRVSIVQSTNQTIHVYVPQKIGGTDHTSSFTCLEGTKYEVEVVADNGYTAGIPNTKGGTINSDMTINATPAEKAQIFVSKGSAPWYNNNSVDNYQWLDKDKVISADESVSGQATVTCKNATNMKYMFKECSNLTSIDLSNFDTSKVTDMGFMLDNCSNLTSLDLSNFDTSNVTNMTSMFTKCSKLTSLDVSNFDTSNVRDMSMMFMGCSNLTSLDVTNFNTSKATDMREMFEKCSKLTSLDVTNFNTSKVTDMAEMFEDCANLASLDVTNFDTSNADNMFFMFKGCSNLTSLDVTKFNTVKVRDMHGMFWDCSKLASIDVTNFDTSNVTDMGGMFASCGSFTSLNVSNFNTSKVTDMSYMFVNSNLTSLDLSNFDTSNVTDMSRMFDGCPNLVSLDLSNFNTSNVKDMSWMFENCANLVSLDLSNFNTSNVTEMGYMFDGCSNLTTLDLSDFDTSKVTYMNYMFFKCYNLTTIKGVIDMKSCTKYEGMFSNCPKLRGVKIKNPPADFESKTGLSSSQYTIVS